MEQLNSLEIGILRILEEHQGRECAIGKDDLVEEINTHSAEGIAHSERKIREAMKHLVTQHGYRIGSCHNGYFIAVTPEEIKSVSKYYRAYGLSMFYTASKLEGRNLPEMLGQLSLELGQIENKGGEYGIAR